jgi:hypothetical protein
MPTITLKVPASPTLAAKSRRVLAGKSSSDEVEGSVEDASEASVVTGRARGDRAHLEVVVGI